MRIAIVGHGPTLLAGKAGTEINRADKVVRLKDCRHTLKHPKHYGKKTDVIAGSWNIAPRLRGVGSAREYWVLLDSRHGNPHDDAIGAMKRHFEPWPCVILQEECKKWDQQYREIREEILLDHRQVTGAHTDPGLGHRHMSQGTKALLYAIHLYPDAIITLYGFDNVVTGEFDWSVTRGPNYDRYPDHNWAAEQKLITLLSEEWELRVWTPDGKPWRKS